MIGFNQEIIKQEQRNSNNLGRWSFIDYGGQRYIGVLKINEPDLIILQPSLIFYSYQNQKGEKKNHYKISDRPLEIKGKPITPCAPNGPINTEHLEFLLRKEIKFQEKDPNQLELF